METHHAKLQRARQFMYFAIPNTVRLLCEDDLQPYGPHFEKPIIILHPYFVRPRLRRVAIFTAKVAAVIYFVVPPQFSFVIEEPVAVVAAVVLAALPSWRW